jgi:ribosomal protein S18 acetylase RimI-like enzyme
MKIQEKSIKVEKITTLNDMDMQDLCDAAAETMKETLGFNLGRQVHSGKIEKGMIQNYWEGVLLVPEIILFVARFEGVIAGAIQVVKPGPANQTSSFACAVENYFIAPWARGRGISNYLISFAEEEARALGYTVLRVSVRETRQAAIHVFEKRNYVKWGVLPKYEYDQGEIVAGYFYYKELK